MTSQFKQWPEWDQYEAQSVAFDITHEKSANLRNVLIWRVKSRQGFKDPGTALMETKPIQVYTNENRL